jgi:hypothetical protein
MAAPSVRFDHAERCVPAHPALRSLAIRLTCNDVWQRVSLAAAVGLLHLKSFLEKRKSPGQFSGLELVIGSEKSGG